MSKRQTEALTQLTISSHSPTTVGFQSIQYQISGHIVEHLNQYLTQASTIMNLVQVSDDYGKSTATNLSWYCDTSDGDAEVKEFGVSGATLLAAGIINDVTAVTGATFRALDIGNNLRNSKYNFGFRSRQLTATGNKTVTMLLPLNTVLGFHHNIDTVMFGVKHNYIIEEILPVNYLHNATGVADDGKFKIKHWAVWMPKIQQTLRGCRRNWKLCSYQVPDVVCTLDR